MPSVAPCDTPPWPTMAWAMAFHFTLLPFISLPYPCSMETQDGLSSDGFDSGKNSDSDSDAAGVRSDGGSGERDPLDRRETLVCDRLEMVMLAMTVLLGSRLDRRPTEKLVSTASRVFRAITKVFYFFAVQFFVTVLKAEASPGKGCL